MTEGEGKNLLENVLGLEKPINTLIEKISNATGALYEPRRIRKRAEAEATAAVVAAKAEIQISDLQRRAAERWLKEEAKKQENLENITAQAFDNITQDAEPENMDEDWIANFFDKAKTISNADAQRIWAKILAGEANSPGAFSKKLVNILHEISPREANNFENLCRFVWTLGPRDPLIFNEQEDIVKENGINFNILTRLQSAGLVTFHSFSGVSSNLNEVGNLLVVYFTRPAIIEIKEKGVKISRGKVLFTDAGRELSKIISVDPIDGYYDYVLNGPWKDHNPTKFPHP